MASTLMFTNMLGVGNYENSSRAEGCGVCLICLASKSAAAVLLMLFGGLGSKKSSVRSLSVVQRA